MNILVTGANGQLGNEMRIISQRSNDNFTFTDVSQVVGLTTMHLDITDMEQLRRMVHTLGIKAIVNCAAYTNVDAAESNEPLAELLNATAPENLALAMKEVGGLLIHISTDYVFGQERYNTPCNEEMKGSPSGVYGSTKLLGEQKILASGCQHVILRTSWLYSEFGKNFCKTMLSLTESRKELKVVFDQVGTPTYAWDLAEAVMTVLDDYKREASSDYSKQGIYNFSNEGVCSWYDFAKMIAEYAGHGDCEINPCHSNEFPSPVTRPSYSVLDKTKIKNTYNITIPYWTESLKRCLANLDQLCK